MLVLLPSGAGHGQDSVTYGGLTLHKPSKWHIYLANGFGGLMWYETS